MSEFWTCCSVGIFALNMLKLKFLLYQNCLGIQWFYENTIIYNYIYSKSLLYNEMEELKFSIIFSQILDSFLIARTIKMMSRILT